MPNLKELSQKEQLALKKIRALLDDRTETNWAMPDEYAIRIAQDIAQRQPLEALQSAKRYIDDLRQQNAGVQKRVAAAVQRRQELAQSPITNAGPRGLKGFLQRWGLSLLNATPFSNFNWIEVNQDGLQMFTPVAPVSQRTITYEQIRAGSVVLSVDPPFYLDQLLGLLAQFRRNIPVPWGELVVYEPGSGRYIARAIALWPRTKLKEMTDALAQIQLAQQPYQGYKRLPRLRDLLIYYDAYEDENLTEITDLLEDDGTPPPPTSDVVEG